MAITYNRRGQHEIVGFVIIVVVVAVIGLIFLSFMIGRGEVSKGTSVEIENLLEASMYQTSDCAISFVPQYLDIEGLVKECYENPNKKCLDNRNSCDVLSEELKEVAGNSLSIGESEANRGYEINIYYKDLGIDNSERGDIIPSITDGSMDSCEVRVGASKSIDVGFGSGIINAELEVCKG